jgi:DNA-binding beta-propeller fold protein YncE
MFVSRNRLRRMARAMVVGVSAFVVGALVLVAPPLASTASAQAYEIWALDQGTNQLHIYGADLKEAARVDLGARGVKAPHMVDFTSDYAYAVIAGLGSGDVAFVRTADRAIIEVIKTGPRTHMAVVAPDDRSVIADVMGDPKNPRTGTLVEIKIDRANGKFSLGRSLVIADDPVVKAAGDKFKDTAPICHEYTADGKFAYVTLGPGLKDGGLVVLDTQRFALVKGFTPDQLKVNCGTVLTLDGKHMIVNGGGADVGVWYALSTANHEVVKEGSSRGHDAHGTWVTPNGKEIWMVNRVTSNGVVLDAGSFEVIAELKDIGKTPDIIAMSPDSRFAFVTLRGPRPITAAHLAKGTQPGFAVIDVATRKVVKVVRPAEGNELSDFHGIGVRVIKK